MKKKSNLPNIKIDEVLDGFCVTASNVDELPTHEVIKRLWRYIRENDLKVAKV